MPELKGVSRDGWEDADVDVSLFSVFTPVDCSNLSVNSGMRMAILTAYRKRSAYKTWKIGRRCPRRTRRTKQNVS